MGVSKKNNFVGYAIIRRAAGLVYGNNDYDIIEPQDAKTLVQVIGKAGIDTTVYAAFKGLKFEDELTDRSMEMRNGTTIYFVHRNLLHLRPELLVDEFTAWYPERK